MYKEMFKERLKKARKDKQLIQSEVSEITKIPRSTLANYETGRTEPDLETLGILADLYEVSLDWLLGTKGGK
jgi:transcriptional regulator with XRE-family HTH domain